MKYTSKNLSYKIRSIEDAIEFDEETEYVKYEQIGSTKKQILDDIEILDKKKHRTKDHRKTEVLFDTEL